MAVKNTFFHQEIAGAGRVLIEETEFGIWSCDLRANERPRKKLHWKGTKSPSQPARHGQTLQLLERIGLRADSLKTMFILWLFLIQCICQPEVDAGIFLILCDCWAAGNLLKCPLVEVGPGSSKARSFIYVGLPVHTNGRAGGNRPVTETHQSYSTYTDTLNILLRQAVTKVVAMFGWI